MWAVILLTICYCIAALYYFRVQPTNTPWPEAESSARDVGQSAYETAPQSFLDDPAAIRTASNSIVRVDTYDKSGERESNGTAFAAFEDGLFVTNWHVVETAGKITGVREYGERFDLSEIVAYDAEKDLAILRTSSEIGFPPLPLGDSSHLKKGEKVLCIGSPQGMINTVMTGVYSGVYIINEEDDTFILFSAPSSGGSSGSPFFNDAGEVVGVQCKIFNEGESMSLAIPIEDAIELYRSTIATGNNDTAE